MMPDAQTDYLIDYWTNCANTTQYLSGDWLCYDLLFILHATENICYQEVHAVKNKNLEAVTEEQLQVEPRSIVQHPGVGEM